MVAPELPPVAVAPPDVPLPEWLWPPTAPRPDVPPCDVRPPDGALRVGAGGDGTGRGVGVARVGATGAAGGELGVDDLAEPKPEAPLGGGGLTAGLEASVGDPPPMTPDRAAATRSDGALRIVGCAALGLAGRDVLTSARAPLEWLRKGGVDAETVVCGADR